MFTVTNLIMHRFIKSGDGTSEAELRGSIQAGGSARPVTVIVKVDLRDALDSLNVFENSPEFTMEIDQN